MITVDNAANMTVTAAEANVQNEVKKWIKKISAFDP